VKRLDSAKLNDWMQVVGIFAVVASLIFVGLQMQLDRRLARAELGSGSLEFRALVELARSDPDISKAWTKMLESPQDLSGTEIVSVNGILRSANLIAVRECYLVAVGVFVECEAIVNAVAIDFFANEYAQTWWRHNSRSNPYGTFDFINDIVTSAEPSGNRSAIEEVRAEF
jgi:hypothetical protein